LLSDVRSITLRTLSYRTPIENTESITHSGRLA
jgi:hypothetical protein